MASSHESPYALLTKVGDRFIVRASRLDWRDSDGGWNFTQGLIHPEFSDDTIVLMVVGELRDDDIWNCYPVPANEAGNLWSSQDLWESDRAAMILTDGEVQSMITNTVNTLRRAFIDLQEKE